MITKTSPSMTHRVIHEFEPGTMFSMVHIPETLPIVYKNSMRKEAMVQGFDWLMYLYTDVWDETFQTTLHHRWLHTCLWGEHLVVIKCGCSLTDPEWNFRFLEESPI